MNNMMMPSHPKSDADFNLMLGQQQDTILTAAPMRYPRNSLQAYSGQMPIQTDTR